MRLAHIYEYNLKNLASNGKLGKVALFDSDCISCQLGKHHALPFNNSDSFATTPFDLIHSNIWGPFPIPTMKDLVILLFSLMIFLDIYGFI